jgi:hypothetical protein
MSVYKEIKTLFKNPQSLLAALAALDVNFQCVDPQQNTCKLISHWHNNPAQDVAIAVNRENAERVGLGDYDGIGFRWTGEGYAIVQDRLDEGNPSIQQRMNALRQSYAVHEVTRQAAENGYTVVKTPDPSGVIRLTLKAGY